MKKRSLHILWTDSGFSLIEILVVMAIIAMLAVVAIPNINTGGENHLNIAQGFIAKTFDDAYIHNRTNFLVIHLEKEAELAGDEQESKDDSWFELFDKRNGLSVLQLEGKKFVQHKRRLLHFRKFPDNFKIEEVVLSNNQVINEGYAIVTFHPRGFAEDVILHVLINGENRSSIRIDRHIKEPLHIDGYVTFEDNKQ